MHAETPYGVYEPRLHPDKNGNPSHSLANRYETVQTRKTSSEWWGALALDVYLPFLDCPQCGIEALTWYDRIWNEGAILTRLGAKENHRFGVLSGSGWLVEVTDNLGKGLVEALGTEGLTWIGSADANPWIGRTDMPLAVALRESDGQLVIQDMVFAGSNKLGDINDVFFDEALNKAKLYAELVTPAVALPAVVRKYKAVYSRSSGALFVIGGETEDGNPSGEIHVYNLAARRWTLVSGNVSSVLAATWSPAKRELVIVDSNEQTVRLVIAGLASGEFKIAHEFEGGSPSFEKKWLLTDSQGNTILACSSAEERRTMLIELSPSDAKPVRYWAGDVGLAAPPVADMAGIVLVSESLETGSAPEVIRVAGPNQPANMEQLFECMK